MDSHDYIEQHAVALDHAGFHAAVDKLASLVEANAPESELQSHLSACPYLLSQQFSHCHHVFPKVCLGNQYEVDFFCLDIPSSGEEWRSIELEAAEKQLITKSGRKTAQLEHALQQIRDWRAWIMANLSYAQSPKGRNGLGLRNIQPRFYGHVIIGRRRDYSDAFNSLRAQVFRDELIDIRSWDGVIEWARKRANVFGGSRG
jgi:Domain of unknown function (DUF4263)